MPKFNYVAVGPDGAQVTGLEEAENIGALNRLLRDRDLSMQEAQEKKSIMQFELTKKKVPRKDLMHFSRQMAVFLRAGIPVIDALGIIREELPKKAVLGPCLDDMIRSLESGTTFTGAARSHPEAFPAFYLGVLEAAELTGNLAQALDETSRYIERDLEARKKITSALFYPAVVFLMSIATVVVLSTFVLPRFKKFFSELHAKLPLPTRMLLSVTDLMTNYWYLLVAGLVIVGLILGFAPRTPKGREYRDRTILKLPVIGDLLSTAIIERFCRTLSSMVRAGVPLPDALAVTTEGTNNIVYRRKLDQVREEMMRGEGLAGPISRADLFPGAARQMIRVGEETGTLDDQLETSAHYFGTELDFKITRFTNLFEPAVILFMGIVVGFVAIALVSAMYGIFGQTNIG
ncbi:MAG TPA: type II secretion system F family protein [Acidimicrobiia bacterium]|nr:type II secretion system F family protein [Acidimicrobiia bacterium]